ncbi:helix-turn-helix domain-containing protein [Cryobacterium arcticum]|uniref:HTH cro/C1-type domain-containing protein n=1 Tax=Cryobacterium arcticum TaxID=670052 RepID=A0A1B1BQ32_9MICO|nr:helix-turn-helix transcriptional regulator [Cryobacterium arcticum]ANP74493.1 hypothetical protein PA27867_3571 [Cryobacterium arcticum]
MKETQTKPGYFSRAISLEIAAQRKAHPDITQQAIAAAIGTSQVTVSHRVNGRYSWTTKDIDAIARLFDLDPFEFVALARRHVGTLPDTPDSPYDMTASQIEALSNATATPREKSTLQ